MSSDRKEEILNVAQKLTQEKGLNGFSYIDISKKINIKTSSIHYYFKTKDDLAVALIQHYHKNFKARLNAIDASSSNPLEKLIKFAEIFQELAKTKDKFCLCGMMAAEWAALSTHSQKELAHYFQSSKQWLSCNFALLESKKPLEDAALYLSLLEGALLIARVEGQTTIMDEVIRSYINQYKK